MAGQGPHDSRTEEGIPVVMPPVRLLPEKELARLALESPILDTAVRLARYVAPRLPVTSDGVLDVGDARRAARELGLLPEADRERVLGALSSADELEELDIPWAVAEELGLIDVDDDTAEPGGTLEFVDTGTSEEILELWWEAAEVVIAEACLPAGDELLAAVTGNRSGDADDLELELAVDAELLYNALENLYLISALEGEAERDPMPGGGDEPVPGPAAPLVLDVNEYTADVPLPVPLPVLAASMVVPEDMEAPTDEALEEVSELMMQLDGALQLIAGTGLVDYRPVDPALVGDEEAEAEVEPGAGEGGDADVSRYGMVRLTPLGIHGVRRHLLAMGISAPAVGDLTEAEAVELLDAMALYSDDVARIEAEGWLSTREPLAAARELLAAARGDEPQAPLRRLNCQQALALLGPRAEPALREVLDDWYLGGLARVRLVEDEANGVPEASEEMVFWLTVDTLAAQLSEDDEDEAALQELVRGIPLQHEPAAFFSTAWQVDHPATADVLEALGRLHPDRSVAKEARKAAFKARSRSGG